MFEKIEYPVASDNPKDIIFYMAISLAKFSNIKGNDLLKCYPEMRRIEVCVKTEVAKIFFELLPDQFEEVEPGWACIASREAGQ